MCLISKGNVDGDTTQSKKCPYKTKDAEKQVLI